MRVAGCIELRARVLPDGVQQAISHDAVSLIGDHQRLVDQPGEVFENGMLPAALVLGDRLGGPETEATGEHAEPREQRSLFEAEQLVAPLDRRPERAMASVRGSGSSGENVEVVVETRRDLSGREN